MIPKLSPKLSDFYEQCNNDDRTSYRLTLLSHHLIILLISAMQVIKTTILLCNATIHFFHSLALFLFTGMESTDLANCLKIRYKYRRFMTDEDMWPPEQVHFTPPLIIPYLKRLNIHFYKSFAKGKVIGGASIFTDSGGSLISDHRLDDEDIQRIKNSKITINLKNSTSSLECPNSNSPRIALIEGVPGIGKTEVMKEIAYRWAQGKLLTSSDLVFLINLRHPKVQNAKSLDELFKYFCHRESIQVKNVGNYVTHFCKDGGKHVTFLLDGYNELPEHLRENGLIARLINKEVLPAAAIVISSRPHVSRKIRQNVSSYVDILGFTKEEQQAFIVESLKRNTESIEELSCYLDSHPSISSLCYVPLKLKILTWLFMEGVKPKSSAELYGLFILHTILNFLTEIKSPGKENITNLDNLPTPYKTIVQELYTLSLKAIDNNQLVFTLDEIKSCCPNIAKNPEALNGLGLLQVTEHITYMGNPTKLFSFIHLAIQEYLAACKICTLSYQEELQLLIEKFEYKNYSNTFALYVGQTKGQRQAFKHFLADGGHPDTIADRFLENNAECLRLFYYFSQANDEKSLKIVERKLYYERKPSCNTPTILIDAEKFSFSSNDLYYLTYFFSHSSRKRWGKLTLISCNILDTGLRMLHQTLIKNGITIKLIVLQLNSLTSDVTPEIVSIVSSCETEHLAIEFNSFQDNLSLFSTTTLNILAILYNLSSHEEVRGLFFTLTNNKYSMLKGLGVNSNFIDDKTMPEIIKFLQQEQLSTLRLLSVNSSNLSAAGLMEIFSTLRMNKHNRLSTMNIQCNFVSQESAIKIAEFLKDNNSLTRLFIIGNMSAEAIKIILKSLEQNNSLRSLSLKYAFSEETKEMVEYEENIVNKNRSEGSKLTVNLYSV